MCVCFFCRLVESKVKNWTFSWFQLRNEFWLLPTSNQRFKFDGKEKTTPKFRQKVQNFHQKFALYDWWQELLTRVWVYENFEVFCILDGNSQVWAINHHLRKTVFNFFWCNCFFLQNGSFHSSTTSERVLMRLHRFSEIRSASFTIKLHLWCHQSFSKQKLDVWSPNQTRKPKIQLFHGILHVSFSKGAACYNFQNSDAVTLLVWGSHCKTNKAYNRDKKYVISVFFWHWLFIVDYKL